MADELAVLVMSCDSYNDVWQPFYASFKRYWAACPYPVYFATDEHPCPFEDFVALTFTRDLAWSERLYRALERIEAKFVLFLQEDFLLRRQVQNERIAEVLRILQRYQAGVMRLFPSPAPSAPLEGETWVGELEKGSAYRVSCQAAIWQKETLLQILDRQEGIGAFEHNGSARSNGLDTRFLSCLRYEQVAPNLAYEGNPIDYVCTAVVKGKWTQEAVRFCRQEGIDLTHSTRAVETSFDVWRRRVYMRAPVFLQPFIWRLFNNRLLR